MHNSEMGGNLVKCFWGKEPADGGPIAAPPSAPGVTGSPQQYPYQQYTEVGYWYPPNSFPPNAQNQFIPGTYGYQQQYPYHQGYRVGGMVPGWQGVPAGQAVPPGAPMMAYPMSQFQTQ